MDKKTKKRLEVARQRIQKLKLQLAGAKQQDDEPGEVDRLEKEIAATQQEVERTLAISQSHLSLDAPITPGEDHRLLDYLPDQYAPAPEDEAYDHAFKDSVENALSSLKEREAKILRLYFGLDDQEPMTLEEIGALMGITRERVRQIKQKALIRLRHASRARFLETFF